MTWEAVELEIAVEFRALSERSDELDYVLSVINARRSGVRWRRSAKRCANPECTSGEFVALKPRTLFCSKGCCERLRPRRVHARARLRARMQADVDWFARHEPPPPRLRRVPTHKAELRIRIARVAKLRQEATLCARE